MIWLAWRRLRGQAILAGAIVLVAVAAALVTGPHLFHAYDTTVARCTGQCSAVDNAFLLNNTYWKIGFDDLVIVVPALFGALVGAPLIARDLETGVYKLAWTQSATRTRWLGTKLAVASALTLVAVGLLSLVATWWASPIDTTARNRFTPGIFDARDIVPLGYALFALVLGAGLGLVIKRTLPAMAATIAAFGTPSPNCCDLATWRRCTSSGKTGPSTRPRSAWGTYRSSTGSTGSSRS
ncbi:MAG: hypothetical protein ACLQK4_08580 [Acidimicrobiales bacterium]|jgi:hypothetical protein